MPQQPPEQKDALVVATVCIVLFIIMGLSAYVVLIRPLKLQPMKVTKTMSKRKLAKEADEDFEPYKTWQEQGLKQYAVWTAHAQPAGAAFVLFYRHSEHANLAEAKRVCKEQFEKEGRATLVFDQDDPTNHPVRYDPEAKTPEIVSKPVRTRTRSKAP